MDELFNWLCFIFMWLMIFGVGLYYVVFVGEKYIQHTLLLGIVSLFAGSLTWLFGGFSLSYFGSLSQTIFSAQLTSQVIVQMLLQQLFCLYAVIMLIGSVLERGSWRYAAVFVPMWVLVIYMPICYLLWSDMAFFAQLGALDYSGGLVVHVTAGIGSLVLAKDLPIRNQKIVETTPMQYAIAYVGMLFITLGWFGFNMAPAGYLGDEAIRVWLNTLLSILGGGSSWFLMVRYIEKQYTFSSIINGMIAGLVGSTCSVGYVTPLYSLLISLIVGSCCPIVIFLLQKKYPLFDDAVDSFGMNATGGIIGSILTGVFAENGNFLIQTVVTFLVCVWSLGTCWLLHRFLSVFINPVENKYQMPGIND